MSWQEKLEILINAYDQGNELIKAGFQYNKPLSADQVYARSSELGFELPPALHDMYARADGINIGIHFIVCGLDTRLGAYGTLREINEELLATVKDIISSPMLGGPDHSLTSVKFIFGADGSSGDFLCVSEPEIIVSVWHDQPKLEQIADSLDVFLDDICMGPGYIRYISPAPGDLWEAALRELQFI